MHFFCAGLSLFIHAILQVSDALRNSTQDIEFFVVLPLKTCVSHPPVCYPFFSCVATEALLAHFFSGTKTKRSRNGFCLFAFSAYSCDNPRREFCHKPSTGKFIFLRRFRICSLKPFSLNEMKMWEFAPEKTTPSAVT